jgi:hypothetical protein
VVRLADYQVRIRATRRASLDELARSATTIPQALDCGPDTRRGNPPKPKSTTKGTP